MSDETSIMIGNGFVRGEHFHSNRYAQMEKFACEYCGSFVFSHRCDSCGAPVKNIGRHLFHGVAPQEMGSGYA